MPLTIQSVTRQWMYFALAELVACHTPPTPSSMIAPMASRNATPTVRLAGKATVGVRVA